MSGHSHWAGIKHKKEITDQKRGKIFSKLLTAVTAAARGEPNPDFNPRLRTAVQKAKDAKVPADNIERAIKKALDPSVAFEELIMEAYGPGGAAILIEAVTDSKNRTIAEIKKILSDGGAKWAEPGSVRWAFEEKGEGFEPKFPQELGEGDGKKLGSLIEKLDEHSDVQEIYTNAKGAQV
ncbi:MAG: YebC/PmpR family DNA-binding transcriptional regulator [Candidatus Liptonbacteria bacterium]|nr:YebC/PmpR family DNA-binding transcriptional regulator [Candidatus Liptonbacteria bacterium]